MRYRTKFIICSLLVGLTTLMCSCRERKPFLQVVDYAELRFPSASAIEFYDKKLYVFGDDADHLLILSPSYKAIDSVYFWAKHKGRIPKSTKHDIESAMILQRNKQPVLYGIGSMSNEKRWGSLEYHLRDGSFRDVAFFDVGFPFPLVPSPNIEGSCAVNDTIVFAHRANLSQPTNRLLFLRPGRPITTQKMVLPPNSNVAGLSGLFYVAERDLLLFTATEEETGSTTDDGAIGDSYLGWIRNFSQKLNSTDVKPDGFLKLSDYDKAFAKQKVESVCMENMEGMTLTLHLAVDNDNGSSKLFKVSLRL